MAKKVKYVALLPLVRFGYPQRENQKIELEVNDKTNTMLQLGYIVKASEAKKATENADKASADTVDVTAADKASADTVDVTADDNDAATNADATKGSTEQTGA